MKEHLHLIEIPIMGPIQIGDRFHTCIIEKELYPPEGSECEKRLIKNLDKPNPLAAR